MKRTKLAVSLVKGNFQYLVNFNVKILDDPENQEKIFSSSTNQSVYYTDNSRNLPWETTLKWAQESLINRDIFTQVKCSNFKILKGSYLAYERVSQ